MLPIIAALAATSHAKGWPPDALTSLLPVVAPSTALPSIRYRRIGPLVLVRPRVYPSAIRPGVLVAADVGALDARGCHGAGWVSPWFWARAWTAVGLPVPVSAVWVPLPHLGAARVLRRLLATAAGVCHA